MEIIISLLPLLMIFRENFRLMLRRFHNPRFLMHPRDLRLLRRTWRKKLIVADTSQQKGVRIIVDMIISVLKEATPKTFWAEVVILSVLIMNRTLIITIKNINLCIISEI